MKRSPRRLVEIIFACSLVSLGGAELLFNSAATQDLSRTQVSEPASKSDLTYLVQSGSQASGRESTRIGGRTHQRTDYQTLLAFRDSVGDVWQSTVQVIVRSRQVAMGAVIHEDGWIVSKSSEIPDKFDVKLSDGTKAAGAIAARHPDMDLALLKIERSGLKPVIWNTSTEIPVGGWLISLDTRQVPLTIGVLSVANRNIKQEKPVLGVRLGIPVDGSSGAAVESIVEGGGADRAGLQLGDIIQSVDGVKLTTRDEVLNRLRELGAGQLLTLGVLRDARELTMSAQMMDLSTSLFDSTEMEVNGQISARATGFKNVMQHDTVLLPHQCGGPLVDIEGRAIGLNIARNGRVASLAYHSKNLEPAIRKMLQSAGASVSLHSDLDRVAQASGSDDGVGAVSIPTSVPTSIQIESLRPDIILPAQF